LNFGAFVNTSRREFFKISLLGSAVLLLGSSLSTVMLAKPDHASSKQNYSFMRPLDIEFFLALTPAILNINNLEALGEKTQRQFISTIDRQIASLDEHSQKNLRQLFDLLTSSSLRYLAGAPTSRWSTASSEQADSFLLGWKNSMFSLKRTGYTALVKLVTMSWYCQAENYQQTGYPGPPKIYLPEE